ncbi:MAG: YezD family protein [Geobacteraceae bacterium]|nr:YezD family protein [Geobacteraceae bacterium]
MEVEEQPLDGELTRILREALRTIRFGTVTLVIQDGRVIQVDKSEKFRLKRQGHIDGCGI